MEVEVDVLDVDTETGDEDNKEVGVILRDNGGVDNTQDCGEVT